MKQWVGVFLLLFLAIPSSTLATHYYISEKGNDTNNGKTKSTPWRSLKRLSEHMKHIVPGDSILLERGSQFQGTLEITVSGLYIGSYGSGPQPVLSGSQAVADWKYSEKNIWTANCKDCDMEGPGNLFINGKAQSLGRYPNSGYMTITGSIESQVLLTDTTTYFTDNHWNNAEVVVRSSRYTLDKLFVRNYINKVFTFENPSSYPLQKGFGYFIQNHPAVLDQHGEWCFDLQKKLIHLYLKDGQKPSAYLIEASFLHIGLQMNWVKNITIANLTFKNNRTAGLQIQNCTEITLTGLRIDHAGKNGLEIEGCNGITIQKCSINHSNSNGVQWHNNDNGVFTNNSICNTGLHPGRGESGNGKYIALYITSYRSQDGINLFQHNTIDSTGYSAIDFRTGNTKIKDNLISNFCLIKDDGGGIYTWKNTKPGNEIENNIIYNGIGSGSGATLPSQVYASGIYIDDLSQHISITGNRIYHCATAGIYLHNAKSISITRNVVYDNGYSMTNGERGQLYIRVDTLGQFGKERALHLNITDNSWTVENEISYCTYIRIDKESHANHLGSFQKNRFVSNQHQTAIAKSVGEANCVEAEEFSLHDWQQLMNYEKGSLFQLSSNDNYRRNFGKNLIANGNMTKDIDGWIIWPEKSRLEHETTKLLDGPSLKVIIPPSSEEALVYHQGFALTKGRCYRLSFSSMSANPSSIGFVVLMADSPWQALGRYTCFAIGAQHKTYTYFFVADKSYPKARINFKGRSDFWLDNVSLHEMVVNK
jgi:parallel beta-helix repeat protein